MDSENEVGDGGVIVIVVIIENMNINPKKIYICDKRIVS